MGVKGGMDLEDVKEEGKWVNQRRGVHLHLLREVVWKVPRTPPIEVEDDDELITVSWECERGHFGKSDWAEDDTPKKGWKRMNTWTCAREDIQTQCHHGNLVVKEDPIGGHSPLCHSAVRHDGVDAGHDDAGAVTD